MNGFFLIKGEPPKLDTLVAATQWITHITRAAFHLEGSGVVRGVTADAVMERMKLWTSLIHPEWFLGSKSRSLHYKQ